MTTCHVAGRFKVILLLAFSEKPIANRQLRYEATSTRWISDSSSSWLEQPLTYPQTTTPLCLGQKS